MDINSIILINSIADKRAEKNFHFIMTSYRTQLISKAYRAHVKAQEEEEKKNGNETRKDGIHNVAPMDLSAYNLDEDNLITYREFMQALKGMKDDTLYKNLLPRTLSFEDVLRTQAVEEEYTISDT